MEKISEIKINRMTNRHIGRILTQLEQDPKVPFWVKQSVKKEMWLFIQNVKLELWNRGAIELDDKDKVWDPNKAIKEQNPEFRD